MILIQKLWWWFKQERTQEKLFKIEDFSKNCVFGESTYPKEKGILSGEVCFPGTEL
jgi:hypothetical protein